MENCCRFRFRITDRGLWFRNRKSSNTTSRCPSMMVSITEIDVVYTKLTAEHQYLLRSSCPVTPYPLNELFHSALPYEYDVYVPPINETYNLGLFNQEIQRVHTIAHTHTSDSPTRIPLVVGYHPAIRSISSIFHKHIYILSPPKFVLLCLNPYLSLPWYVLTSRKFFKWTFRSEPELSVKCYGVIDFPKSSIFPQDHRERAL